MQDFLENFLVAFVVWIAVFAIVYLAVAFVAWDVTWLGQLAVEFVRLAIAVSAVIGLKHAINEHQP